jgi:hypothetical protein
LLYDLGLEAELDFISMDGPLHLTPIGTISPITVRWPPMHSTSPPKKLWNSPPLSLYAPLPLCMTAEPTPLAARAACTHVQRSTQSNRKLTSDTVMEYLICHHDMAMICLSNDPYGCTFEEKLYL